MTSSAEEVVQESSLVRKRRQEPTTTPKKRAKEEEKENLTNQRSPSSPSPSEVADGWRTISIGEIKTLSNFELPSSVFDNSDGSGHNFFRYGSKHGPLFLTRNVRQKKELIQVQFYDATRKPRGKLLSSKLTDMLTKTKKDQPVLFNLQLCKMNSWSTGVESIYPITANVMIDCFIAYVDKEGRVKLQDEGLAIIPASAVDREKGLSIKPSFNRKSISLSDDEKAKTNAIYIAVRVSRMTIVKENEKNGGMIRLRTRTAAPDDDGKIVPVKFESLVRYGCRRVFDREKKVDDTNLGIGEIFLVSPEDGCFLADASKQSAKNWFSNTANLVYADKKNKSSDNSHLPRVMIEIKEPVSQSDPGAVSNSKAPGYLARRATRIRTEELTWSQQCRVICPFRKTRFKSLELFGDCWASRYPGFKYSVIDSGQTLTMNIRVPDLFLDHVRPDRIINAYRRTCDRSCNPVQLALTEDISDSTDENEEEQYGPRNKVPESCEKKFGFDFIQSSCSSPVISTVYENRMNHLIPQSSENRRSASKDGSEVSGDDENSKKGGKRRKEGSVRDEYYPVNNAAMYCDFSILHKEHRTLLKLTDEVNEMQVVESSVTQQETNEYNKKFSKIVRTLRTAEKKKSEEGDEDSDTKEVSEEGTPDRNIGIDIEGNPIPSFVELFFPYGKNELYNVFQRFFYAKAGIRPGVFTADWKSRVMTGFLVDSHKMIFENGLDNLFKKHLQLIALTTEGWKLQHHDMPLQKFKELKGLWRKSKDSSQNT